MNLIQTIRNSIYNPDFYQELFTRPVKSSIKYFYSFVLVLVIVSTVFLAIRILPVVNNLVENAGPAILSTYPEELRVDIKGGEVKTNVAEPYAIPIPENFKSAFEEGEKDQDLENLVVIDTIQPASYELVKNYKTAVLISKNTIAIRGENNKVTIQSMEGFPDFTITKANLTSWVSGLEKLKKFMAPVFVIAVFIGMFAIYSFNLVYLFLAALFIWAIFRLKKINAGYWKAYQVGIHAMTLSMIIETFQLSLPFGISLKLIFTAVLLLMAWINLKKPEEATSEPITISV